MIIKSTLGVLAILIGTALCSADKVDASGCGLAEVQAVCSSQVVHLRPGQVRRAQRRAARAARRQHALARRASCGVAATCAAPVRVSVIVPEVQVHVAAPCCE